MKKLFLALVLAAPLAAYGQAWPAKPIRWVVPYTGGGITDTVTRVMTQKMQTSLGQPIVVDNRPGANSILGADIVAKAPPDGYTMLTVIAAHAANATLYAGKLPFDTVKGFAPISLVGIAPLILTVNNDLPAKDVKQLIAYAKANPGKINFGSSGIGAAAHLTTELLKQTAGIDMVHVRGGKIRSLAMFSAKRIQGAPDVPTIAEAGGPPIESSTWVLFLAPAGTPRGIVDRLSAETAKAINESGIKERFGQIGIEPVGGSPEQAGQFLDAEMAKWAQVINAAGVKAD